MPPRYAYWTILVDNQPTAFRSAMQEDLMPTFKRLKHKHPSAEMKWFQNGRLWDSRTDAQEAMLVRGERGRAGDTRQGGGFRDRKRSDRPVPRERPEWKPKGSVPEGGPRPPRREPGEKLEWKPKGEFTPAPKREFKTSRPQDLKTSRPEWKPKGFAAEGREPRRSAKREGGKPEWKPKGEGAKPEWKPKGSFTRDRKPEWKPKRSFDRDRKPEWKSKREGGPKEKLDWKPKGFAPEGRESGRSPRPASEGAPEKRKWIPKEEYKRSQGIAAPRDRKWRPGGDHKDPRQKYKDAKKAKWTKFKKTVRTRFESKQRPKKKDE